MAIAFVQVAAIASAGNNTPSLPTMAFPSPPTAGNTLVVMGFGWSSNLQSTSCTFTDPFGHTYTIPTGAFQNGKATQLWSAIGYTRVVNTGADFKITVTPSAPSYINVVAVEFSGVATTNPLHGVVVVDSQGQAVTTAAPGNLAVGPGDVVIATLNTGSGSNPAPFTTPAGFTSDGKQTNGSLYECGEAIHAINPTSPSNPTWTVDYSWLALQLALLAQVVPTAGPAAASATWVVQAATVSGGATKVPASPIATWSAQAPAVTAGAIKAATTVVATWSAQAPAVTAGAIKAATTVVATWSAQAPAISAGSTTTAPVPLAIWTASTPAVSIGRTTAPATVVATWSAQAPAVSIGRTTVPATVVATWTASVPTVTYLTPPQLTATPVSPSAIDLSWTPISGAAGYTIQAEQEGTTTWYEDTVGGGTTTYRSAVPVETTWNYRVRATDGAGNPITEWSAVATASTAPTTPATVVPAGVGSAWVATGPVVVASASAAPPAGGAHWTGSVPGVVTGGSVTVAPAGVGSTWIAQVSGITGGAGVAPGGAEAAWTGLVPVARAGAGPVVPVAVATWVVTVPMVTTGPAPVVIPGPSPYQSSVTRLGPDPWEGGATALGVVPDRGTILSDAVAANYSSVARTR